MEFYLLEISPGVCWIASSTPEANGFLFRLASVLALKKIDPTKKYNYPKLIFFMSGQHDCVLSDFISNDAWEVQILPTLLRYWFHKDYEDIMIELSDDTEPNLEISRMWATLHIIIQHIHRLNGFLLHSALIKYKDNGVLLVGSGGIGKSTACRRLPPDWTPLSDDQVLITLDEKNGYFAHPAPTWSDFYLKREEKEFDISLQVPLKAIFFLQQSEFDEIVPVNKNQTIFLLNKSTSEIYCVFLRRLNLTNMRKMRTDLFHNSYELALKIPAYILKKSLHGKFWEKIAGVI